MLKGYKKLKKASRMCMSEVTTALLTKSNPSDYIYCHNVILQSYQRHRWGRPRLHY